MFRVERRVPCTGQALGLIAERRGCSQEHDTCTAAVYASSCQRGPRDTCVKEATLNSAIGLLLCPFQEDVMQRVADGAGPALEGTKAEAVLR